MNEPKERTLLASKMGPNIVEKWDSEQIEVQNGYLKMVHDILGDDVLKSIPADLIRTSFTPQ